MEVSGGIEALDADLTMAVRVFPAAGEVAAVAAATGIRVVTGRGCGGSCRGG